MLIAYTYILLCSNGCFYTGSTKDLDYRLLQHSKGEGANYTRKYLPVILVYFEIFERIDQAFKREKQIQGWSKNKKIALINGWEEELKELAKCMNETNSKNLKELKSIGHFGFAPFDSAPFDSAQGAGEIDG